MLSGATRRPISAAPCVSVPMMPCSSLAAAFRRFTAPAPISERYRHRYEVNIGYKRQLEEHGLVFSGLSPDGVLPEIIEIPDHPWFVGRHFHPDLKSRPLDPHPLFASFIG